jgi:hypothetical protein
MITNSLDTDLINIEIHCDREDHDYTRSSGIGYFSSTRRDIAVRKARDAGWSIRGGRHICPTCLRVKPTKIAVSRLRPIQRKCEPVVEKTVCVAPRPSHVAQKRGLRQFVCKKCKSRLFIESQGQRICSNCLEMRTRKGEYDFSYEEPKRDDHVPTDAAPGSAEKIAVLAQRVALRQPLWHENDRCDYQGMTGAVEPRKFGPKIRAADRICTVKVGKKSTRGMT